MLRRKKYTKKLEVNCSSRFLITSVLAPAHMQYFLHIHRQATQRSAEQAVGKTLITPEWGHLGGFGKHWVEGEHLRYNYV